MLEHIIRKPYQVLLVDKVAHRLNSHITPLQITLLGGVFGLATATALTFHHGVIAIIFLLFSGYCDTLDGTLARISRQESPAGSMFDILTDRIVEFAVILGLWFVEPTFRSLSCILMLGSILLCVTSFLTVGIFTTNSANKSFYYSPGLMERTEAFIFFILMILMPSHFTLIASIFSLLVILTTIIRCYEFATQSI